MTGVGNAERKRKEVGAKHNIVLVNYIY